MIFLLPQISDTDQEINKSISYIMHPKRLNRATNFNALLSYNITAIQAPGTKIKDKTWAILMFAFWRQIRMLTFLPSERKENIATLSKLVQREELLADKKKRQGCEHPINHTNRHFWHNIEQPRQQYSANSALTHTAHTHAPSLQGATDKEWSQSTGNLLTQLRQAVFLIKILITHKKHAK